MNALPAKPRPGWLPRFVSTPRRRLTLFACTLVIFLGGAWSCMIRMPGRSWSGPLPSLTDSERTISAELKSDIEELAGRIGSRSVLAPTKLAQAVEHIERRFQGAGYSPRRQTFAVDGVSCHNLEVERRGSTSPESIVIIGAHYDSVHGCPGA